ESGQIGSLTDHPRTHVAITRPRMKLIILGSSSTLGHHAFYRDLYERCHKAEMPNERESEQENA
uniref:hypothetical protein n=1 Tax=Alloprevotella sp. TaxID=1872471 RepID=UPI0040284484